MLSDKHILNKVYSSNEATEKSFKNRNGKKDYVLHISTHGFFNEKSDQANSMLESGLFFAGANRYWSNDSIRLEPEQDDGILRAAEISELNLNGCSLVVLSACETGLGYSDTSEGIFGLQRAFRLAGANYVLMSLWDVDDRATAMLMTEFYKNLLDDVDLDTALKNSKKRVREFYPSPKDWGGFVLLH
jgi:CHAT domain-containing protein